MVLDAKEHDAIGYFWWSSFVSYVDCCPAPIFAGGGTIPFMNIENLQKRVDK